MQGRAGLSGFSLIEVMVAMVIGMLGIIVMMQMFRVFEGQKRTTTGGDDAISSGAISLYGIQRNIQQSGLGISSVKLLGCTVTGLLNGGASIPLAPVTIYRWDTTTAGLVTPTGFPVLPNPDPNTDVLVIVSGNANGTVDGDIIRTGLPMTQTSYPVSSPTSFAQNDRVVAAANTRPSPCSLALKSITNSPVLGSPVELAAAPFTVTAGDFLYNLGQAPTVRAYAIRSGNLTVCDYTTANCSSAANWVPVANNVVSMRAEYGRDTNVAATMDGIVDDADGWDQTVATPTSPAAPNGNYVGACALLRVAAVRIVLVARSSQPERTLDWPALTAHVSIPATIAVGVTTPVPWMGSDGVAYSVSATEALRVQIVPPDPTTTWPTWQDFRYKVFQTTIPLRNITTQGAAFPC